MAERQTRVHAVPQSIVVGIGVKPKIFRNFKMVRNADEYMQQENCTPNCSYPDERSALDAANDLLASGNCQIVYITQQSHEEPLRLWYK